MTNDFKEVVILQRTDIGSVAERVKALMKHSVLLAPGPADPAEVKANIMLAYRHLEDARMRLGKVLQAYEGPTANH